MKTTKINKISGIGSKMLKLELSIVLFEEDGVKMVYCPSLDLIGYGRTDEKAKESFRIVLEEFLKYTIENDTLESELKRMGWQFKKRPECYVSPTMSTLIEENDDFSRIINNHDFAKMNQTVKLPVAYC